MDISIYVKSGTGGYNDYDDCDLLLKRLSTDIFPIPRIGESIDILEDNDEKKTNPDGAILQEFHEYLVTDVRYWINGDNGGVSVYVVPIGRHV